jgi:hypothetical protein
MVSDLSYSVLNSGRKPRWKYICTLRINPDYMCICMWRCWVTYTYVMHSYVLELIPALDTDEHCVKCVLLKFSLQRLTELGEIGSKCDRVVPSLSV